VIIWSGFIWLIIGLKGRVFRKRHIEILGFTERDLLKADQLLRSREQGASTDWLQFRLHTTQLHCSKKKNHSDVLYIYIRSRKQCYIVLFMI
jgi:hypothetical protein